MKKFISFALLIAGFTLLCIYFTEKTDVLGLENLPFSASFSEENGQLALTWRPLPYPCFYRVEAYFKTTGLLADEPEYHLADRSFTVHPSYRAAATAIPMYYRVTAYGLFGRLAGPSQLISNPDFPSPPAPVSIFHYTKQHPASLMPYLVWHSVPTAVCYEVEILSAPPENEQGTALSQKYHLFSTQQVYTNGWQADLTPFMNQPQLYWRVRALNLQKQPVGVFSKAEPLVCDPVQPMPNRPLLNDFDQMPNTKMPLYPVYHWIPMHNITHYEVELLTAPPLHEHNTTPTPDRAWYMAANDSFSCYDEYARPYAGEYYWRVRAIDDNGNTIGTYSDTDTFTVETHLTRAYAAAFGDSITHGGGAVSYSPANHEYNYMTYLDFPTLNLGRSGDTSHTTLLRFDTDVLPYQPYNLLILTGSNNLRSDTTAAEIIADLAEIRRKCEENDIRPIFLTLMPIQPENIYAAFQTETDPEWHEKMDKVNAYIRTQPFFIDLEPYFYDTGKHFMDTSLATDGLHPDIRGKMLMAEIINRHAYLLRK